MIDLCSSSEDDCTVKGKRQEKRADTVFSARVETSPGSLKRLERAGDMIQRIANSGKRRVENDASSGRKRSRPSDPDMVSCQISGIVAIATCSGPFLRVFDDELHHPWNSGDETRHLYEQTRPRL